MFLLHKNKIIRKIQIKKKFKILNKKMRITLLKQKILKIIRNLRKRKRNKLKVIHLVIL